VWGKIAKPRRSCRKFNGEEGARANFHPTKIESQNLGKLYPVFTTQSTTKWLRPQNRFHCSRHRGFGRLWKLTVFTIFWLTPLQVQNSQKIVKPVSFQILPEQWKQWKQFCGLNHFVIGVPRRIRTPIRRGWRRDPTCARGSEHVAMIEPKPTFAFGSCLSELPDLSVEINLRRIYPKP